MLADTIAGTRRGTGAVLAVTGEAGIGKSRLLGDCLGEGAAAGIDVLPGRCFEADQGMPYAPLVDLMRDVGADVPELRSVFHDGTDLEQRKRTIFHALDDAFSARATAQPVILAIEDLHWCDEATLDFLAWFTPRVPSQPILLLLTWRHDESGDALSRFVASLERQRLLREVQLGPLDPAEVEQLLRALLHQSRLVRADVVDAVCRLSDGNPFFIEEVLASSPLDALGSGDLVAVPRTVRDAVQRRIDRLSPAARDVLRQAAVTGHEFDFDLLQALMALDEPGLLMAMRQLVDYHLVIEHSAERFAFRHALTREAVLASLLSRERRTLHRQVARALEERGGAESNDLGGHWFAAEEWGRALPYLIEAGQHSLGLHAPGAAIVSFTRAIDAATCLGQDPPAMVCLDRARAYDRLGDFERAREDYEHARALARTHGDDAIEWQATLDLGLLWSSRDYQRAGQYYRDALTLARASGDERRIARSLNGLGNWHVNILETELAIPMHEEALAILDRLDDRLGAGRTLDLLGMACTEGGDLLRAVEVYERAAVILEEQDDPATLASTLSMLIGCGGHFAGVSVSDTVSVSAILELTTRARDLGRQAWQPSAEAFALLSAVQALIPQGELGRALTFAEEAVATATSLDHRQWMCGTQLSMAVVRMELLDPAQAHLAAGQAFGLARELGSGVWSGLTTACMIETCLAAGDIATARGYAEEIVMDEQGSRAIADRAMWHALALLALAENRAAGALAIVDRLVDSAANMKPGVVIPALWRTRARALTALGRTEEARALLDEALPVAGEQNLRTLLWRLHRDLAQLDHSGGNRVAADRHLDAAREVLRGIAGTLEPAQRDDFLARAEAAVPGGMGTPAPASPGGLSPREVEVLRHLAAGLGNAEIAGQLVLSERTVGNHLANIYAKLDLSGRSARAGAVAYAIEHGLGGNNPLLSAARREE